MDERWSGLIRAHEAARPASAPGEIPPHEPKAAILACSDARVSPSAIFAQPAGSLFVVRIAGNTAAPAAVASLDYAVERLGVGLIVVLGHTECGAVAAAMSGACDGAVEMITGPICAAVSQSPGADANEISERNVVETMATLGRDPGRLGASIRSGQVEVVGAVYDISSARVIPIHPLSTQ